MKNFISRRLVIIYSVVFLLALTPYLFGIAIESKFKKFNHTSINLKDTQIKLVLKDFKRNYFSSTACVEFQLTSAKQSELVVLSLDQHIIHGPLIFDLSNKKMPFSIALAYIKNNLGAQFQAYIKEKLHTDIKFVAITKLSFLGNCISYIDIPEIKQTIQPDIEISLAAITSKIHHSLNSKQGQGELLIPKIILTNKDSILEILQLQSKFNTMKKDLITLGTSNLKIKELSYTKNNNSLLNFKNLKALSKLETALKDTLSYTNTINIGKSQILKQSFSANEFSLTAKPLSAKIFTLLQENFNQKSLSFLPLLKILFEDKTTIAISMPKHLSHTLFSWVSLQLYTNGIMGKIDPRPQEQIFEDLSKNIVSNFEHFVAKKILICNEDLYKLDLHFDNAEKILLNNEEIPNPFAAEPSLPKVTPEQSNPNETAEKVITPEK